MVKVPNIEYISLLNKKISSFEFSSAKYFQRLLITLISSEFDSTAILLQLDIIKLLLN